MSLIIREEEEREGHKLSATYRRAAHPTSQDNRKSHRIEPIDRYKCVDQDTGSDEVHNL
jgi:hypothetical protein